MGENSAIERCDHTFNPWIGCQAVSPACEQCYAEAWVNGRKRRAGVKLDAREHREAPHG